MLFDAAVLIVVFACAYDFETQFLVKIDGRFVTGEDFENYLFGMVNAADNE